MLAKHFVVANFLVENAVVYSLLVCKNIWWCFFPSLFLCCWLFRFALISAEVVSPETLLETKYFLVSGFGLFFFFFPPSVLFLKHFHFFMVRTLIYDNPQGTFSTGNIHCSVKNAPEENLKGHKVKWLL